MMEKNTKNLKYPVVKKLIFGNIHKVDGITTNVDINAYNLEIIPLSNSETLRFSESN